MLKIELCDYGVEDVLKEIAEYLEEAIESNSKKRKNEMMHKALGAIDTLYYMINVTEVNIDTDSKSDV